MFKKKFKELEQSLTELIIKKVVEEKFALRETLCKKIDEMIAESELKHDKELEEAKEEITQIVIDEITGNIITRKEKSFKNPLQKFKTKSYVNADGQYKPVKPERSE